MRLITRDDFAEYVRARLGHPVLDLELELAEKDGLGHVHLAIQDSLDWFYREMNNEGEYQDYLVLYLKKGQLEYDLPSDVADVIDVTPTFGNGFTPWQSFDTGPGESLVATTGWSQFDLVTYTAAMGYLANVKKLVGQAYTVHFHPMSKKLRVLPTPKENRSVMLEIYRKEKVSEVFGNILFRDLAVARTRYIWGTILIKDSVQLPGGGSVNGERILSLAEKEIERSEKAIMDERPKPFIMVG